MFERLSRQNSSNDLGPEHIIEAVYDQQTITDVDEATMGLPTLRDFGSDYFTNYYVVIPLTMDADVELAPFVFDMPETPALTGVLGELASFYGIESVEEIAAFDGQTVPLEWPEGYPQPALNKLRPKGSEENPYTADDVNEMVDEE